MPDPVSWFLIEPHWEVVTSDGERVGEVTQVLADENADIFDGLVVDPGRLKKLKYVPAEVVGELVEGRIALQLAKPEFERLEEYESPPVR